LQRGDKSCEKINSKITKDAVSSIVTYRAKNNYFPPSHILTLMRLWKRETKNRSDKDKKSKHISELTDVCSSNSSSNFLQYQEEIILARLLKSQNRDPDIVFQRQQKAVQDETRRTQKFSENRFLKKENFSKKS
jgi:hypothetical protein